MKVLGVIPSRFESSRFPGKPLVNIAGKSMVQRVFEQASKCSQISKVIVATDDKRIFDHVISFGGDVVMTSEQHKNGTERCGEVINKYTEYDVVINIQGDEPLIQPEQLSLVLNLFNDQKVQIGTLVKKTVDLEEVRNPNRIKVVLDNSENALYFSRSPIPYSKNEATYFKHIGIYAWRIETLKKILQLSPSKLELSESLEQLRWLENGYSIKTATTNFETPNVDTPEDVEKVLQAINA